MVATRGVKVETCGTNSTKKKQAVKSSSSNGKIKKSVSGSKSSDSQWINSISGILFDAEGSTKKLGIQLKNSLAENQEILFYGFLGQSFSISHAKRCLKRGGPQRSYWKAVKESRHGMIDALFLFVKNIEAALLYGEFNASEGCAKYIEKEVSVDDPRSTSSSGVEGYNF